MHTVEKEYLTAQECAHFTGFSVEGLRRMRREGRGPKWIKPSGQRRVFYRRIDVEAWMSPAARNDHAA
jgi:predicted DNA-binding transcriptional regulator AlpA